MKKKYKIESLNIVFYFTIRLNFYSNDLKDRNAYYYCYVEIHNSLFFRFLSNLNAPVTINVQRSSKKTNIAIDSTDKLQKFIEKGTYNVMIDDVAVLSDFQFKAGAVYTIVIYETSNRTYVSRIIS